MADVDEGVGTCDNCGQVVRLCVPRNDVYAWYWYHPDTQMIWCYDGTDVALELRGLRADPYRHRPALSR